MLTAVLRSAARRPTIVPSTITSTQRRTVLTLSKTAATASGAGRNGDGRVWQRTESGAAVSLGYSSCFLGALQLVAKNKGVKLSEDVKIKAAVSIGEASGGFGIGVELTAIGRRCTRPRSSHGMNPFGTQFYRR
ncbi:hypothetical protein RhiLY_03063 [Ceratobasidium sp. AG-Ba]|nr:hypothetical protein RhiLY_03063 [Ceratobasidium sp. AG-Ba]